MYEVKVEWISAQDGGRETPPPVGDYFAVSRFPEDTHWQNNAWSVAFKFQLIRKKDQGNDEYVSEGTVHFLVEGAPHERMEKNEYFFIYEGAKIVAKVFIGPCI